MPGTDTSAARRFGRLPLHRLGRPATGAAVAWVPLAAIICGLFTGALVSRAAWETSRRNPTGPRPAPFWPRPFPATASARSTLRPRSSWSTGTRCV